MDELTKHTNWHCHVGAGPLPGINHINGDGLDNPENRFKIGNQIAPFDFNRDAETESLLSGRGRERNES